MHLRPLRDRVGMRRMEADRKTAGGILFGKRSDTEVRIDGEEPLVMKESGVGRETAAGASLFPRVVLAGRTPDSTRGT